MSCPNYKIIFNDETNYVAQDISEEPVVRVIPAKGEQGETGPKGEDGKNFEPTIVSELPATGDESKLYLTPKAHTTSTATGNPITASVAEDAGALESFQLDGDTFQQTYEGKNLVGLPGITFPYTLNGITISKEKDGSFTFNGTLTTVTNFDLSPWKNHETYDSLLPYVGQTVTLSCETSGSVTNLDFRNYGLKNNGGDTFVAASLTNVRTAIFNMTNNTTMLGIRFGKGTFDNWNIKIQLELGSTATSYEQYVGGQPSPNPDYPQPIQTVTGEQTVSKVGKNLFDKNNYQDIRAFIQSDGIIRLNDANRAVYIPCEPNTTYTVSHIALPAGSNKKFGVAYSYVEPQGGTQTYGFIRQDSATSITITTDADARYLIAWLWVIDYPITYLDYLATVQIEKSSSATAYAPYSKIDYPINLGKNLFDNTGWRQGQYNNGEWTDNLVTRATTPLIPIEPTTYTISLNSESLDTAFININYFDSSKNWLGNRSTLGLPAFGNVSREQTFTLPQGASYLAITIRPYGKDGVDIQGFTQSSLLMLEKGSTKTDYAPYKTPIELCKLGTYQDYIYKDGDDWKIRQNYIKITELGDSSWIWDATIPRFSKNGAGLGIAGVVNTSTVWDAVSNKFIAGSFDQVYTNKTNGMAYSPSGFISVVDTSWTDVTTARASLSGGVIYCRLRIPTDTVITDQTLIAQLEAIRTASLQNGTNTITNTATGSNLAGDMEIGYYGFNPRNRYDKWLWLDINNEYEQLNNPDTASSTLNSTRNLNLTNIQSDSNEIKNDEEQENEILDDMEEEER